MESETRLAGLTRLQKVVQQYCRRNHVDRAFVAAVALFHAAVNHGFMGQYRGKTLVEHHHRFGRQQFAQTVEHRRQRRH